MPKIYLAKADQEKNKKVTPINKFDVIAKFLGKADDGQMDSDTDKGDVLDDCEASTETDRGGDLSNSDTKDPAGSNEFNKKGSASTDWNLHSGPAPEDFTRDEKGEVVCDPQKPPANASVDWNLHSGPAPEDFTRPNNGEKVDDPCHPPATADLDTEAKNVGNHTVVPPYNKDASPETDPSKKVGDYDPPSRDETTAGETCDEDPEMTMAVWNTIAYISQKERDKVDESDFAGPHKSFPIRNAEDVKNAAHLVGHGKNPTAIKRKIIEIARRKGLHHALPDTWRGPDEQSKASAYEQALALLGKMSKDEKKKLSVLADTPEFEEQAVRGPQEGNH
jgi:hypothetical protein